MIHDPHLPEIENGVNSTCKQNSLEKTSHEFINGDHLFLYKGINRHCSGANSNIPSFTLNTQNVGGNKSLMEGSSDLEGRVEYLCDFWGLSVSSSLAKALRAKFFDDLMIAFASTSRHVAMMQKLQKKWWDICSRAYKSKVLLLFLNAVHRKS